jgi:hypothetical protein
MEVFRSTDFAAVCGPVSLSAPRGSNDSILKKSVC